MMGFDLTSATYFYRSMLILESILMEFLRIGVLASLKVKYSLPAFASLFRYLNISCDNKATMAATEPQKSFETRALDLLQK